MERVIWEKGISHVCLEHSGRKGYANAYPWGEGLFMAFCECGGARRGRIWS